MSYGTRRADERVLPKRSADSVPESSPVEMMQDVLSYLRGASGCTLGLLVLAFLAAAGLIWAAALIGIQPFAAWIQTGAGALQLFMMVYVLILILGCLIYGLYYALLHARAWPQAARATTAFLTGGSDWAILVRQAVLPLAATVFLYLAARSYYICHFAAGCRSMRMMAAADNRAIVLGGIGGMTLALVTCLRIGWRLKREPQKRIEAFRAWLQERAALRSWHLNATSSNSNHRVLLETERAEIESILNHFNKCFPPK
jgi:hypothetical protein